MSNKRTLSVPIKNTVGGSCIRKILAVASILIWTACGGSPPKPIPMSNANNAVSSEPAKTAAPPVYTSGTGSIKLPGVYVSPLGSPTPGIVEDGPYVFAKVDFDTGKQVTGDRSDVELAINARQLRIRISSNLGLGANKSEVSYDECKKQAENSSKTTAVGPTSVPTDYICVVTDEGRLSQFRLTNIDTAATNDANIFDIIIQFEYRTW